jgi:regulatory protein
VQGVSVHEVPDDPAQAIPDADPESVARAIVLRRLTMSAQTRQQLEQALARKQVPDDVARRVLDRMTEVGLIDDAAYAIDYVEARRSARGLSRRSLAMELRRKGVGDADAEQALEGIDGDSDRATAKTLVERKWSSVSRLDRDAARRRLVGQLARRGFSPGMAFEVIREVEAERGSVGSASQQDPAAAWAALEADDAVAATLIADGLT